jgi:hypothetical protein
MVSFRFHIVSLVAVFLALALGIGMGVTVIDKATVDLLQERLDSVRNQVNEANQRSDALNREQTRADDYESRAESYLIADRLRDVPVVVVAFRGIDQDPLDGLRETLRASGANTSGVLWVTPKLRLDDAKDVAALAEELGTSGGDVDSLRRAVVARLGAVLTGAAPTGSLAALVDGGYMEWTPDKVVDVDSVDVARSRVVVASGYNAAVPNDQLAVPLTEVLAGRPSLRVVAVESGRDADSRAPAQRAVFVGLLRNDNAVNGKLSTIDDLEASSGRVAVVLALAELAEGRTGDYGYGNGVDGVIPKLVS